MKLRSFFATGALCLALVGASATKSQAQISQDQFNEMLKKSLESESGQQLVGAATENYLKQKQVEARKKQAEMQQAELENQFKNPVKIEVGKSPVKGPATAKVTVIEFSDFQCPYCKKGKETMDELLKAYPNDVKIVFKNMPLEFHPNARPAAKAAMAANKQGKFWEFYDALFSNQEGLSDKFYTETAQKLGLNMDKFNKDLQSADIDKEIDEDIKVARENGISGTPGFFVNGVAVKGAYPIEYFKDIVDRWLKDNKK